MPLITIYGANLWKLEHLWQYSKWKLWAFAGFFAYFSCSRCLAYKNRVRQEGRPVSLLPDLRDLVYYCDFSTGRISNFAHKMQTCTPCPRRNMLQSPDLTYRCGQFYPCRWCHWNHGDFCSDAVSSSWRCTFWIWALGYYLKHVVICLLVVGSTLLCVDSWWLQGVCSQCTYPLSSQNLASGTTYIITAKISFELCLGKALCTSVGDSHQCVWCCFLAIS